MQRRGVAGRGFCDRDHRAVQALYRRLGAAAGIIVRGHDREHFARGQLFEHFGVDRAGVLAPIGNEIRVARHALVHLLGRDVDRLHEIAPFEVVSASRNPATVRNRSSRAGSNTVKWVPPGTSAKMRSSVPSRSNTSRANAGGVSVSAAPTMTIVGMVMAAGS